MTQLTPFNSQAQSGTDGIKRDQSRYVFDRNYFDNIYTQPPSWSKLLKKVVIPHNLNKQLTLFKDNEMYRSNSTNF